MYRELLEKIKLEKLSANKVWHPSASEDQIENLILRTKIKLNAELPVDYVNFLRVTNGFNWNGIFVYATDATNDFPFDFVEMNLNYRDVDYFEDLLVFGDGNIDIYTFQISAREYQIRDRVPADNINERYGTFDEMITGALRSNL